MNVLEAYVVQVGARKFKQTKVWKWIPMEMQL